MRNISRDQAHPNNYADWLVFPMGLLDIARLNLWMKFFEYIYTGIVDHREGHTAWSDR